LPPQGFFTKFVVLGIEKRIWQLFVEQMLRVDPTKGGFWAMKKADLVSKMAEKSGLNKKQSEAALDAFIQTVEEALQAGDKVQLVGFGTFETRHREARTGRNPGTGEEIQIPASTVPVFKAGKGLKDAVK
jgi:DNA-binding protein HU-beta